MVDSNSSGRRASAGKHVARSMLRLQSDARLVELFREGHEAAFETLVERYQELLIRRYRRLAGATIAEDVVQQTFEKAIMRLKDDPRPIEIRPWLYRIAHNILVDHLRRKESSTERLAPNTEIVSPALTDDLHDQREHLRDIVIQIAKLPERERSALLLRELEGREYSEIAALLDTTVGNARKLTQLARGRLRDALGGLLPLPVLRLWLGQTEQVADAGKAVGAAGGVGGTVLAKAGVVIVLIAAVAAGGEFGSSGSNARPSPDEGSTKVALAAAGDSSSDGTASSPHAGSVGAPTARHALTGSTGRDSGPGKEGSLSPARPGHTAASAHSTSGRTGGAGLRNAGDASAGAPATSNWRDSVREQRQLVRAQRVEVKQAHQRVVVQRLQVKAQRQKVKEQRSQLQATRQAAKQAPESERAASKQAIREQRQKVTTEQQGVAQEQKKVKQRQGEVRSEQADVHQQQQGVYEAQRNRPPKQKGAKPPQ